MTGPLQIIGVDEANVGQPKNDGTPGSGLYAVPIKLNRRPTRREADLLVANWDRPPQFTTMHRPGIAEVRGNALVLTATTIDEVRDYHAKTASLAVGVTNQREAELRVIDESRAAGRAAQQAEHEQHVAEVAKGISF